MKKSSHGTDILKDEFQMFSRVESSGEWIAKEP